MAKDKQLFFCTSCGNEFHKWSGKCLSCGEWNTIKEFKESKKKDRVNKDNLSIDCLKDIKQEQSARMLSGINEFDIVCGGGVVPGSVILIGGEPGIGKSTLALQIASKFKTLYVSGEESPYQLKDRADRLKIKNDKIYITKNTVVEEIAELIEKENIEIIIVDSIQTITTIDNSTQAGSISQLRESTGKLSEIAKRKNISLFIIGHITKEGNIAGPKILEHIVDTVLYFEGDFTDEYRILRSFKNRFGSINEIGVFQMCENGLVEVENKNSVFLNPYSSNNSGIAVSAAVEGSRTILYEIQSLVSFSSFSNPRRMSDGFDLNRLILICAVLEKHAACKLSSFDVFLNVAGGFNINETASDLAVALSIVSSYKEKPLNTKTGFLGEISLSGEIRPVNQVDRRVKEFINNNFECIFISKKDARSPEFKNFKGEVIAVETIKEAVEKLF